MEQIISDSQNSKDRKNPSDKWITSDMKKFCEKKSVYPEKMKRKNTTTTAACFEQSIESRKKKISIP